MARKAKSGSRDVPAVDPETASKLAGIARKVTAEWMAAGERPGYLDEWAKQLVAAVGKDAALRLLASHRRAARDPSQSPEDRKVNRERAKVLEKYL